MVKISVGNRSTREYDSKLEKWFQQIPRTVDVCPEILPKYGTKLSRPLRLRMPRLRMTHTIHREWKSFLSNVMYILYLNFKRSVEAR